MILCRILDAGKITQEIQMGNNPPKKLTNSGWKLNVLLNKIFMSNLIFAFIEPLFLYIQMYHASYKQGTIKSEFNRIIGECGKDYSY